MCGGGIKVTDVRGKILMSLDNLQLSKLNALYIYFVRESRPVFSKPFPFTKHPQKTALLGLMYKTLPCCEHLVITVKMDC